MSADRAGDSDQRSFTSNSRLAREPRRCRLELRNQHKPAVARALYGVQLGLAAAEQTRYWSKILFERTGEENRGAAGPDERQAPLERHRRWR